MIIEIPKIDNINANIDRIIWRAGKIAQGEDVSFDFHNIPFIRPETVILLIIASQNIFQSTGRSVNWVNLQGEIPQYLERINLSQVQFINFENPHPLFRWTRSSLFSTNLIEVEIIKTPKQVGDVVQRTCGILNQWFPGNKNLGYSRQVAMYIMEIANNSLEHSSIDGQGTCYFTLQKYATQHQQSEIVIAFGDAGIGIRESLKVANPRIRADDTEAIRLALIEGISGRANGQGGAGFQSITNLLRQYGGRISIRSGKGSVCFDPKNENYYKKEHNLGFVGTQTSFVLQQLDKSENKDYHNSKRSPQYSERLLKEDCYEETIGSQKLRSAS